ncbi:proline iminopeptidase [Luteibacter sp. 621]|uniref:alpha/beta fold hydrolase n=1 Tax=Luteibacter sp. 621 TaxID=3373916 RepID=UPI003D223809
MGAIPQLPVTMLRRHTFFVSAVVALILAASPWTTPSAAPVAAQALSAGGHDATVNGVRLHYDVGGSGPLLVIQAPGWGVGSSYLRKGLAPLEASFTVVTVDPRNSGQSDRVRQPEKLTDMQMVDDLESLRSVWGVERFALLGHSNGGAIALAYAELHPDHVSRLVLVGTELPTFARRGDHAALDHRRHGDKRFEDAYRHVDDATETDGAFLANLKATLPLYVSDPDRSVKAVAETLPETVTVSSTAVYATGHGKPALPASSAAAHIRIPVMLIVGEDDWPCTPAPSRLIHERIPGSVLRVYPQAGHFTWIERADLFFPDVIQFLSPQLSQGR